MEGRMLSYATLYDNGACRDYRDKFEERYGDTGPGVLVTVELAVSQAMDWDWYWAAENLLTPAGFREYERVTDPFRDTYTATMTPVWAEKEETVQVAQDKANEVRRSFADEYSDEAWSASYEARRTVMGPMYEKESSAMGAAALTLNQGRAKVFAELFIKEGSTGE